MSKWNILFELWFSLVFVLYVHVQLRCVIARKRHNEWFETGCMSETVSYKIKVKKRIHWWRLITTAGALRLYFIEKSHRKWENMLLLLVCLVCVSYKASCYVKWMEMDLMVEWYQWNKTNIPTVKHMAKSIWIKYSNTKGICNIMSTSQRTLDRSIHFVSEFVYTVHVFVCVNNIFVAQQKA